ncbi:MAG: hypothetical protein KGR26_01360 [Cyanobacteria bacterium REEB65]|nr:hypothetical protein [Cyanobacteria bacterium REEB65]
MPRALPTTAVVACLIAAPVPARAQAPVPVEGTTQAPASVPPPPAVAGSTTSVPITLPQDDQPSFVATASISQVPAGSGFHLDWPPKLPPLLSVEAVVGPRFGKGYTIYPAFASQQVGATTITNLSQPILGSESRDAGAFGGEAKLDVAVPFVAPELGVNFDFLGGSATAQTLDSGNTANNTVTDVLPSRSLGVFAKVFGLMLEYRNLNWSQGLPDASLGTSPSGNVGMLAYDLDIPMGPIEAEANLGLGAGRVASDISTASAMVAPVDGKVSLALKLYGIKIEAGVRAEALAFGSDFGKVLSAFNLNSLTQHVTQSPSQTTDQVRDQIQSTARASYAWGPFVQAGIAF